MFVIFCVIGTINTLVDLIIFLSLQASGVTILLANIISTSIALALSYILNKRFTFRPSSASNRAVIPFVAVTLTGLWILQPVIIYGVINILDIQVFRNFLNPLYTDYAALQSFVGKLVATPASLIWNYVLYKNLVFKPTEVR